MKIRLSLYCSFKIALFAIIISAVLYYVLDEQVQNTTRSYPVIVILGYSLFIVIMTVVLSITPVGVINEKGVSGFNTLSWYKKINWQDVTRTKKIRFGFLRYQIFYTSASRWGLWLPLEVKNPKTLYSILGKYANLKPINRF